MESKQEPISNTQNAPSLPSVDLLFCLTAAIVLVLSACAPTPTPTSQVSTQTVEAPVPQTVQVPVQETILVTTAPSSVTATPLVTIVRVATGYIPNVQFAPFYVALEKGYFAEEGLQVILDYGTEQDPIKKIDSRSANFGVSSGDAIILARANGVVLKYVMRWYNEWPICIFSLKANNITKPEDLVGKTIGLPGPFGPNWVAYQTLLAKQGIDPKSVPVQMIGSTQVTAVDEGQVEAATGFAMNELVQLQSLGKEMNVINVSDYVNLAPIGIFTSEQYIKDNPDTVQKFVRGFLRGIKATLAEPDFALEAVIRAVQYSGGNARGGTQASLNAAMQFWTGAGDYDAAALQETQDLLLKLDVITANTNVADMFTNEFVDHSGVTP